MINSVKDFFPFKITVDGENESYRNVPWVICFQFDLDYLGYDMCICFWKNKCEIGTVDVHFPWIYIQLRKSLFSHQKCASSKLLSAIDKVRKAGNPKQLAAQKKKETNKTKKKQTIIRC